ncbi:hypothetical protein LINPERHAP2_LOCUS3792 [Linum perenne]
MIGLGVCATDGIERLLQFRMATRRMVAHVKEVEVMALLDAMTWMRDLGFREVDFESDAKTVVDSMNRQEHDETYFRDLVKQCKGLLEENPGFEVIFGRRSSNMMAHSLARHVCLYGSAHCGVSPPIWLCNLLDEC